jgi:small conductance mechanosensitive channel
MRAWFSIPLSHESWGDIALSVLAIAVSTLLIYLFVTRQANRARKRFNALLSLASNSDDPEHELAVARRRLTTLRLVVNGAKYVLVVGALLMTLRRVGVPLDSLLLPAGFIGAALGLGAQNLVRDVVAGLFIVFEGQLAVGDVVTIEGKTGKVEEVGLRVTRLRDANGHDYYFPNGSIAVVNKHPRHASEVLVRIPLAEAEQKEAAQSVVVAALVEFDADYRVLDSRDEIPAVQIASASSPYTLLFRLRLQPQSLTTLQTRLPSRLNAALESSGIKKGAGAEIEIFDAPAPSPDS